MTRIETIATWAASLSATDVPADVLELCRAQRRSVLGGMAASSGDAAARRVLAGLDATTGDGAEAALYAGCVLSIALDFDDYVCFGHTGHTAVLAPLYLAGETGASGDQQLVAQVVANEAEARLGGACLIGPLNGQLWSFIHAAGTALAAGRLLGLGPGGLAHALAIALYQAPRPTVPGFMAPDTKLLTAAEPAMIGLRAARLAAAGVTGPLDLLDHRQGFLDAFADAPLPAMLGGLGEAWATRTLCVKPYPGCAYVDTTVDALLELGPPAAGDVESVTVEAGMLTCAMDALSRGYAGADPPTAVTINFSVPWTVAATLLGGELTPHQFRADWLAAHRGELGGLASRVSVVHDAALTRAAAAQFTRVVPPRAVVRDAGWSRLRRGLRRARGHQPSVGSARDAAAMLRPGGIRLGGRFWHPAAVDGFVMTFPARVRVRLRDGRELVGQCDVPRGGAGHPTHPPGAVAREKLLTWGPELWGDEGTATIDAAIDSDDDRLSELVRSGASGRGPRTRAATR